MSEDARLNARARLILATPKLLKQLAQTVQSRPGYLDDVLAEISDPDVNQQMRSALDPVQAAMAYLNRK